MASSISAIAWRGSSDISSSEIVIEKPKDIRIPCDQAGNLHPMLGFNRDLPGRKNLARWKVQVARGTMNT
eukprot:3047722-Pyramimonas_sp.AAC.1